VARIKRPAAETKKYLKYLGHKMKAGHQGLAFELSYLQPGWLKFPSVYLFMYTSVKTILIFSILMTSSLILTLFALRSETYWNAFESYLKETEMDALVSETLKSYEGNPEDYGEIVLYIWLFYIAAIAVVLLIFWLAEMIYYSIFRSKLVIDAKNKKFVLSARSVLRNTKVLLINTLKYTAVLLLLLSVPLALMSSSTGEFFALLASLFFAVTMVVLLYSTPELFYVSQRKMNLSKPYSNLFMDVWYMLGSFLIITAFSMLAELITLGKMYTASGFFMINAAFFYLVIVVHRIAILKHVVLRILLALSGKTPLRLRKFLNQVAETGIMYKYGGQWRFRHQAIYDELIK
jgi:hypothetical protein